MYKLIGSILLLSMTTQSQASDQRYALLTASTQTVKQKEISDAAVSIQDYADIAATNSWLTAMSPRLEQFIPERTEREDFLRTVHYEATRAGLDPQLVLSVIQVESNFNKYAVSSVGARGYMQVMPFWIDTIGSMNHNLFHLRVNLRYGCMILRHYLNKENGNYFRALGRYNGSLGKATYPQLVLNKWRKNWHYPTSDTRS
ncbi:MAG: transglycosylase SLT domain-containing protein [Betaproteobacteria bacterium]|nr:transglycosylase SLT domain-containing protein [Betaproteobacteria bacterium]